MSPDLYTRFKSDVINCALGPEDIQFSISKRQVIHGPGKGRYPVCEPCAFGFLLQHVKKRLKEVHRRDPGIQKPGKQDGGCSSTATNIRNL